jgi:predicted nucleotidyltransferase
MCAPPGYAQLNRPADALYITGSPRNRLQWACDMTRDEAIAEITRKLVEFYSPIRIYLFGSVARDDDGPDSDLDFLVVIPDDAPEEQLRPGVARNAMRGTGFAKDIVPWRKTDFEERAAWVRASLPATVVREGRLLYETR